MTSGSLPPRPFRSHELVRPRADVLVVRPVGRLRAVSLLAFVPGAVILVVSLLVALERPGALLFAVVGAVFVWAGIWARGPLRRFDVGAGLVTAGYPWSRSRTSLRELRSLELVAVGECVPEDADPYETWRLDAVFSGGRRLDLTNHSDLAAHASMGAELSAALGVPFRDLSARQVRGVAAAPRLRRRRK